MRSFPTLFAAEKNKRSDLAPVWFLRLTVNAVDYWLADNTFSIATWQGGITTLPWIASWGQLQEGIAGGLAEFHVSDIAISCLIDQDTADNMEHLATVHDLEESPAELYLWFHGLNPSTDPPQQFWTGNVRDVSLPDDLTVELRLEDESVKMNNYVGRKLTVADYPLADPDDIGKVIPIVFGTVPQLPALCVDSGWATTLSEDVSAAALAIIVSELPAASVIGKTVTVDDERMFISAAAGKTLTVTRGYNSTATVIHTKGSVVVENKSTPLVYLLADHALDSIDTVLALVRGLAIDITADAIKYLGTVGNQLAAYPGKAAITIPDFASVAARILLALNGAVTSTDTGHTHAAGSVVNTTTVSQTATGTSTTLTSRTLSLGAGGYITEAVLHTATFAAVAGIISSGTMSATVTVNVPTGYSLLFWYLRVNGVRVSLWNYSSVSNNSPTITLDSNSCQGNTVQLVAVFWPNPALAYAASVVFSGYISAASRTVTYSTTGNVSLSSNGSNVAVNSTLELSGNSVADIALGDKIVVDVTHNVTAPAAVLQYLLDNHGPGTTLATVGTMPGTYALNGAITDYRRLLEWCNVLAFQCRSRFRMSNGSAQLIVRPDTLTSVKTINHSVQSDGMRVLSRTKAPLSDVLNKITVLFDRDWTKTGAEAYRQTAAGTDSASISIYGERERPDLFQFDFVTGSAMAASVLAFYLAKCSTRPWRYTFDLYLDHSELEFADAITLGFLGGQVTEINEARLYPGDQQRMDKITFITEG